MLSLFVCVLLHYQSKHCYLFQIISKWKIREWIFMLLIMNTLKQIQNNLTYCKPASEFQPWLMRDAHRILNLVLGVTMIHYYCSESIPGWTEMWCILKGNIESHLKLRYRLWSLGTNQGKLFDFKLNLLITF